MIFKKRIGHRKKVLAVLISTAILFVFCINTICFAGKINFLKVRGKVIKIGDTADRTFTILKKSDIVNQTVGKDPNNPNSLLVIKNYRVRGLKFTIYFARPQDPGPYKIIKIVEE